MKADLCLLKVITAFCEDDDDNHYDGDQDNDDGEDDDNYLVLGAA